MLRLRVRLQSSRDDARDVHLWGNDHGPGHFGGLSNQVQDAAPSPDGWLGRWAVAPLELSATQAHQAPLPRQVLRDLLGLNLPTLSVGAQDFPALGFRDLQEP